MPALIARIKAMPFLVWFLLLLGTGCEVRPPPQARAQGLGEVLMIDDFKTGQDALELTAVAQVQHGKSAAGALGGTRCTFLGVTTNPFARRATVEISGGADGFLALDTGAGVHQAMALLYGWDEDCNPRGIDVDLKHAPGSATLLTDFQIEMAVFDIGHGSHGALDLGTAGEIALWSDGGVASAPLSITAGDVLTHVPYSAFDADPGFDWEHVRYVAVEIQSGGSVPGHDYVLRSVSAVAR